MQPPSAVALHPSTSLSFATNNLVQTSPLIVAGYAKKTKALAVRAGFKKFLPEPPNTSFPITTPNAIPTAACHSGSVAGSVNGYKIPVTRNPSFIS